MLLCRGICLKKPFDAYESVKGSILYSTLEPCCFTYPGKRQPACTERIIREGITTVIISQTDPNPKVNGHGIKRLRDSGITVITGILEDETRALNEIYTKNMTYSSPFVHLKVAQTIDGNLATKTGDSKWITDCDARKYVHQLRSRFDAILIGSGTAEIDNPELTIRHGVSGKIKRIIIDRNLKLPLDLNVFKNQKENPTIVIAKDNIDRNRLIPYVDKGIKVMLVPQTKDGRIVLKCLLQKVFDEGIRSILVEGGSAIFSSFIEQNLYDKISIYIAPKLSGPGLSILEDFSIKKMNDAIDIVNTSVSTINNQIVLMGYRG